MMTRRRAWLTVIGLFLGFPTKVAESSGGILSIDLGQWSHIDVVFNGRTIRVTPAEIFEALR